jgi:hypothetical protein
MHPVPFGCGYFVREQICTEQSSLNAEGTNIRTVLLGAGPRVIPIAALAPPRTAKRMYPWLPMGMMAKVIAVSALDDDSDPGKVLFFWSV